MKTITIFVNEQPRTIAEGATLLEWLQAEQLDRKPLALEINQRIVPRGELSTRRLADGDRLEMVALSAGG